MKLICLFLLVGVTLLQIADATIQPADCKEPLRKDKECLNDAMKSTQGVFIKLQNFMCKYQTAKEVKNIELLKAVFKEMKEYIRCMGCDADFLLGADITLENITAEEVNDAVDTLVKVVISITGKSYLPSDSQELTNAKNRKITKTRSLGRQEGLETDETALQAICPIVAHLAESTFLKDLTQKKIQNPNLLTDLAYERTKEQLDYKRVFELLKELGSHVPEALLDDKTDIFSEGRDRILREFIDIVLDSFRTPLTIWDPLIDVGLPKIVGSKLA